MSEILAWDPLQPFGVKINLDLRHEGSGEQIEQLRELFDTHHLLYFPDQSLSPDDQQRVSGWFGPIADEKGATCFSTDSNMGKLGGGELAFHSDLSCTPEPLLGISLHALNVARRSSPTQFIDAMAVAPQGWPGTRHPVLNPHPRTGQLILYINASHSDRIVELRAEDSESLIQDLFGRLYDPTNRYDHHWRNGDFVIWDNLALQHARSEVPPDVPRTLQRVEIGSATYRDLMPPELLETYLQN